MHPPIFFFFFFNDTATTEIYTLSLHDALPISHHRLVAGRPVARHDRGVLPREIQKLVGAADHSVDAAAIDEIEDRKSTRLNSSHSQISYAVFCLKKKKKKKYT